MVGSLYKTRGYIMNIPAQLVHARHLYASQLTPWGFETANVLQSSNHEWPCEESGLGYYCGGCASRGLCAGRLELPFGEIRGGLQVAD